MPKMPTQVDSTEVRPDLLAGEVLEGRDALHEDLPASDGRVKRCTQCDRDVVLNRAGWCYDCFTGGGKL